MDISDSPTARAVEQPGTKLEKLLWFSLCAWVLALAIYQFSENTADPDLWGHVVFGQQMLKTGAMERTETYSWTAGGQPFINHEWGADLILGGTHLLGGGPGLLLLKLGVGLITFLLSLRLGTKSLIWPASAVAWAVAAIAVVEISFGFAARPQIFTCLGLVLVLMLLRRLHEGSWLWALVLLPLFVVWVNVHGGVLAGVGLLLLAAGSTTVEWFHRRSSPDPAFNLRTVLAQWLASLGVIGALFCNPWGSALPAWLINSVLWFRPEIQEWNPTPLGLDNATLFILIAVSAFALAASRRRRALWEVAVCGAFAVLALRSVRNAPLFALVALALVPPHLADALNRF